MYSVEDLLISHGYKPPKNALSPCEAARYGDCRRESAEKGSGHGTANGHETDAGAYVCSRQPAVKGYSDENERKDRNQRRKAGNGNQGDTQPPGDFLTRDSGLYDRTRGIQPQPRGDRDVSYWRRRGQDFSVLLDYADYRELRGSGFTRPTEGAWISLGDERGHERQRWEEVEREAGRDQWRATGDRKCQSLGMEDWRPAAGRQLSQGEQWTQGQLRIATSDVGVDARTKGKSLSLPRVLFPESLQYVDMSAYSQSTYGPQRLNGSLSHRPPHNHHGRDWFAENGHWPGSHGAALPKPRFSRPLRPPSYEAHQQTRGSSEMLAGDQGPHPKGSFVPRQDSFASEPVGPGMEPPVYIPPPSYERPLLHRGTQQNYSDMSDFRLKGAPFQQAPHSMESGRWVSRPAGGSWLEQPRERSAPCRKQVHPGLSPNNVGWVQYLPFDDPRVRHISGGPCESALADADKVRHSKKDLPSAKVLEQSTHHSAFPATQGQYVSTETDEKSLNEHNNGHRLYSGLHKESGNSIASNQSCNEYQKDQAVLTRSSGQCANLDKALLETVTQVKKIEPGMEGEKKQNSKRRLNETIFCLVSVPLHLQPNRESCDQNNNQKPDQLNPDHGSSTQSRDELHSQSQLSTSLAELELQTLTENRMRDQDPKRPPSGKDPQPLYSNNHKELYSGSWPGDQYRDQETQTSCPAAPKGDPQALLHKQGQVQGPSATDPIADNGVGGDCSAFGYPIKGQKSLNPSSNSAFSRTANFPSKLCKPKEQPPAPGSPLAQRIVEKSLSGNGQEAFGQFLLKPVSRRPWDAIEELESFNKELELQMCKRPSMDQCIDDLDQAYRDILELSTTSDNYENGKAQNSDCNPMKEEPQRQPNKIQHGFENRGTTGDPKHGKVRSAFSRPPAKTVSFQKLPKESSFGDCGLLSHIPLNVADDCRVPRSDIPVLKDSLLRDVGLTVYTEVPEGPRELTQDVSILTSPPDYEDVYQTLLLSRESAAATECNARNMDVTPQSSFRTFGLGMESVQQEVSVSRAETERKVKKKNLVSGFSGEKIPEDKGQADKIYCQWEQPDFARSKPAAHRRTNEEVASVSDEEASDNFDWPKELSLAEKHLEELLINEKANSLPKEDLSNLYEVQCAEGIPEKESIEERAARILGIKVPAESLAVGDHKPGTGTTEPVVTIEPEPVMTQEPWESNANGKLLQVQSQYEEVSEEPMDPNGLGQEEEEVAGPGEGAHLSGILESLLMPVAISSSDGRLSLSVSGDLQGCGGSPEPEAPEAVTLDAEVMEAAALEAIAVEIKELEAEVLELEALEPEIPDEESLEAVALELEALEPEVPEGETLEIEVLEPEAWELGALQAGVRRDGMANLLCQEAMENLIVQPKEWSSLSHMEDLTTRSLESGESNDEEEWNMQSKGNSTPQFGPNDSLHSTVPTQPRNATVAKREITLPLDLSEYSHDVEYLDEEVEEEMLHFSDSYDPSRVERV
ncbi:junctional cadherin 5-associated protein [Conger conger]|uniref:junctional cadherin 5-associated protein n=1 Tax=Conger conger TaxID=82655 RepID=UPI002A5A74F4|nr:junctional cadherin 5-associated protein [Conger conger]